MAQVTVTKSTPTKWTNTVSSTVNILAGSINDTQISVVAVYDKTSTTPTRAGWDTPIVATIVPVANTPAAPNKLIIWTRTLTSAITATTENLNFGVASSGHEISFNTDGVIVGSIILQYLTDFGSEKILGEYSNDSDEATQLSGIMAFSFPRSVEVPADFTELYDDSMYVGGGGLFLGVAQRDAAAATNFAPAVLSLRNEVAQETQEGDRAVLFNAVLKPRTNVSEGVFTVNTKLPSIAVSMGSPTYTVQLGDTVTLTATSVGTVQGLTWSIVSGPGSVDSSGEFTTTTVGTTVVRVQSDEEPDIFDTATVTTQSGAPTVSSVDLSQQPLVLIRGTGEPGATLRFYLNSVLEETLTISNTGSWTFFRTLFPRTYTYYATQEVNEEVSDPSATLSFTVSSDPGTEPDTSNGQPYARTWFKTPRTKTRIG